MKISGSKNASLPIIAASLVTSQSTYLTNVPNIKDIDSLLSILSKIGTTINFKNNKLYLKHNPANQSLLFDEVKKFRASYYLMSVYLALFNEVEIYYPGGCSIGSRPIDFHLEGFMKAGCVIEHDENIIRIMGTIEDNINDIKPILKENWHGVRMGKWHISIIYF